MRFSWNETELDDVLAKALVQPHTVTLVTHNAASSFRYALINRVRRKRKTGTDYTGVPFTITCKERIVSVSVKSTQSLIVSVEPKVEVENDKGRETLADHPVPLGGGEGGP